MSGSDPPAGAIIFPIMPKRKKPKLDALENVALRQAFGTVDEVTLHYEGYRLPCPHCRGILFESESPGTCCGNVHADLLAPYIRPKIPSEFFEIIRQNPKAYTKKAYALNRSLALSSTIATIVPVGKGFQALKVSGQVYTQLNSILPSRSELHDDTASGKYQLGAYAQIYWSCNDVDEADYRIMRSNLPGSHRSMVLALQQFLKQHNRYVQVYKAARHLVSTEGDDVSLVFNADGTAFPGSYLQCNHAQFVAVISAVVVCIGHRQEVTSLCPSPTPSLPPGHHRAFSDQSSKEVAALLPALTDGDLPKQSVVTTASGGRKIIGPDHMARGKCSPFRLRLPCDPPSPISPWVHFFCSFDVALTDVTGDRCTRIRAAAPNWTIRAPPRTRHDQTRQGRSTEARQKRQSGHDGPHPHAVQPCAARRTRSSPGGRATRGCHWRRQADSRRAKRAVDDRRVSSANVHDRQVVVL